MTKLSTQAVRQLLIDRIMANEPAFVDRVARELLAEIRRIYSRSYDYSDAQVDAMVAGLTTNEAVITHFYTMRSDNWLRAQLRHELAAEAV